MVDTIRIGGIRADLRLGLAQLERDAKKAVTILGGLDKRFKVLGDSFNKALKVAGGAAALGGTVFALKKLSDVIGALAEKGEQAGSIAEGFQQLGGSVGSIEAARKATLGLVDSFDLMAAANKGLLVGLKDFDKNFANVADLAGRVANALGTDTKEAVNRLTEALAKGNAKALREFGIIVEANKDKAKVYADAIAQIPAAMERLGPITDSVANAQTSLNNSIEEGLKRTGIAINSNQELTRGYRELDEQLRKIDWEGVGEALAAMERGFLAVANALAGALVPALNDFIRGWNYLFGSGNQAQADRLASQIDELQKRLKYLTEETNLTNPIFGRDWARKEVAEIEAQLPVLKDAFKKLVTEINKPQSGSSTPDPFKPTFEGMGQLGKEAEKLQKKIQGLREQFKDFASADEVNQLKEGIQAAIEAGNEADFTALKERLSAAVTAGFRDRFSELATLDPTMSAAIESMGTQMGAQASAAFDKQWAEAQAKRFEEEERKTIELYERGFDAWSQLFTDAINGTLPSLEDALKQVAIGFAAQLANALTGGLLGNVPSLQGLGQALASSIISGLGSSIPSLFGGVVGGSGSSGLGGLSGALGASGISSVLGSFGGGAGVMLASGEVVAAGSAAATAATAAGTAVGSAAMPGVGVLGALGPYGAAAAGVAIIAAFAANGGFDGVLDSIGLGGGPTNPETLARREMVGKLEDLIREIGGLKYFDSQGNLQTIDDIKLGSSNRFNTPGWAEALEEQFGVQASNAFKGVGEALAELLGITEDVGGQIGAVLLEQMGGDIEGLKALIDLTGLSYEKFIELMIQRGKEGDATWLEIVSTIRDANAAFQDGIEGTGMYAQAFSNLLNTGGKGQIALNQAVNIAIEAMEEGMTSVQELQTALIASGEFTQEELQALFDSLAQNGITTLEQLATATDLTLAQIIAALDANLQDSGSGFRETTEAVDELTENLNALDNKEFNIHLKVTASLDGAAEAALNAPELGEVRQSLERFATGGVLGGPTMFRHGTTLGLAGEAGPEAILPLQSINGKLGVSARISEFGGGGLVVHIDARGSEAGVEQSIRRVMDDMEGRLMDRTLTALRDSQRRGAW